MTTRSQAVPVSLGTDGSGISSADHSAPSTGHSISSNVGSPTSGIPNSPARRTGLMNALTRNFFGGNNRERSERNSLVDLVTQEGSIKKEAWTLMSRGNTNKTRVRTLANLQDSPLSTPQPVRRQSTFRSRIARIFEGVMKNRNLQVSTLEGIWHETQDMLGEPETREPTLRAIIELTETQHNQLGLALRHTFFEKIRDLGCEEKTIKWLNALSEGGKNVNGFEKAMDFLVADWLGMVLAEDDHPDALKVIQLAQELIKHNSAFVCEASMITMVRSSCARCARFADPHTSPLLDLLSDVMKYSELPRSELPLIVTSLCSLVLTSTFCDQSWGVARNLLNSQMGHRTRKILIEMLKGAQTSVQAAGSDKKMVIRSLRGAVYFLVQSTWGTMKIESVRSSPAFVTDAFERAVGADPAICCDILLGLRRLVHKFGRELQHISWQRIVRLFHIVHEIIQLDASYSNCRPILRGLLDQLEQLHKDGHYTGNSDELYELMESCLDCRGDDSILAIMKYREKEISQLQPDWLVRARNLVDKYAKTTFSTAIRREAIASLQALYTQSRSICEHEIVTQLLLPTLEQLIPIEEECQVQYQMWVTIFEITRSVPVRPGESALFDQVLEVISRMLIDGLPQCFGDSVMGHQPTKTWGGFCMENQEVVVKDFDELLNEKWQILPPSSFRAIIDMLIQNVAKQYELGQFSEAGVEVRAAVFSVLYTIKCCPITRRLMRYRDDDAMPMTNVFIRLSDGRDGDFSWKDIADITVVALEKDRSWAVTSNIISGLGRVLEYTDMIRSAGVKSMEDLVMAVLKVSERATNNTYFYRENASDAMFASCEGEALSERHKQLPIVLATLIGYTLEWENRSHELCRQIVDYARQGSIEAIIASSVALQRVPDAMSSFALLFVELLASQDPTPKRAIPVIEFFSDAAHVDQFSKFFGVDQYKQVTDCLSPYTIVRYYNPYIVALAHRALMVWFTRVPDKLRPEMRRLMVDHVHDAAMYYYPGGMSRQPSGDGRHEIGSIYQLGGAPDTPPPMGGSGGHNGLSAFDEITEEIERALNGFFVLGRIDDIPEDRAPDKMVEIGQEHFLVSDQIITVRTLIEREDDDVFSAVGTSSNETPSGAAATNEPSTPSKSTFSEQRRRYQSAVMPSSSGRQRSTGADEGGGGGMDGRRAMDDMDVARRERSSTTTRPPLIPQVTYTQLIVRSMYGRCAWLMKNLELLHVEYEQVRRVSTDAALLMQHFAGLPTACLMGKRNEDQIATRLRNLDRVPGLELFAVGVLYKAVGQTKEAEFLRNVYGSERYSRFIKLLGEVRSLTNCPGGLIRGKHGTYTYEYKDEISRIVFLIASLMPTTASDPACNEKKKLIGNNFVTVVFNESGSPYRLPTHNAFTHVAIEISPIDATNSLVFVHARSEVACWLGIQKVVLSDALAARITRQLVIRANLAVNVWRSMQETPNQPYLSMAITRLRMIRALRDKCQALPPNSATLS